MVRIHPDTERTHRPQTAPAHLRWHAQAPTEPGWYWMLEAPHAEPRIVFVLTWDGETLIESDCGLDVEKMGMQCWAGPIEAPRRAPDAR